MHTFIESLCTHAILIPQESGTGESVIEIKMGDEDAYIAGHTIDGRVLFPATGYLVSVLFWSNEHLYI